MYIRGEVDNENFRGMMLLDPTRGHDFQSAACSSCSEQDYLISSNLMSKTRVLLAGMLGKLLLPYARFAGMVSLRSPPTDMPATPISQPLMTSPAPSLNENGFPFVFARVELGLCS